MITERSKAKIKKIAQNKQKEIIKQLQKQSIVEDLTNKGYTLKAGLKYGCDFRIYAKGVGIKQGKKKQEEHSFAILDVVKGKDSIKIKDLVAKARVACATNMKWLISIDKKELLVNVGWVD